jgi:hypothetical protein
MAPPCKEADDTNPPQLIATRRLSRLSLRPRIRYACNAHPFHRKAR